MLNVFITVDVEIWCGGWKDIDSKFPNAYNKYILGKTASGDYGLPFQIKLLNEYGLKGVFFVEPLYAARFGLSSLKDIVGMLQDGSQEVQMHMHPEWVNEATTALIPDSDKKRQHMKEYSLKEQVQLVKVGKTFLNKVADKDVL